MDANEFRVEAVQWTATRDASPHCKVRRLVVSCRSRQALPCLAHTNHRSGARFHVRFSRQIHADQGCVDPHPDTIPPRGSRRVLRACEETIERLAKDPRYFEARAEPVPGDPLLLPDHRAGTRLLRDRRTDRAPVHQDESSAAREPSRHAAHDP
jgi:hypothetical protein